MNTEKLDTILSVMYTQDGHKIVTKSMVQTIISAAEYETYSSILIKDGYACSLDRASNSIALTEDGALFIKKGGYSLNSPGRFSKKKHKRFFMVLTLLLVGVSVLILFIKLFDLLRNN